MITNWRKPTVSVNNSACVETGWTPTQVGYRDSKQAPLPTESRPTLLFPTPAAHRFLTMLKSGTCGPVG